MDIFRTLIIPAAHINTARASAELFGPSMTGMWPTQLSADGSFPGSHYVASGYLAKEFTDLFPVKNWAQTNGVWAVASESPGDAAALHQMAAQAGVDLPVAAIQAMFDASDITDQEPYTAFARLGLQIARPVEEI